MIYPYTNKYDHTFSSDSNRLRPSYTVSIRKVKWYQVYVEQNPVTK